MPKKFGTVGPGGPNGNPADRNQPALGIVAGQTWQRLNKSFAAPTFSYGTDSGEYTDPAMRDLASKVLFADNLEPGDNPLFPEGVDRTFATAPDIAGADATAIQDATLSSSQYVPNTASPGANADGTVNLDPNSPARVAAQSAVHEFSSHPPVNDSDTTNPATSAKKISDTNLNDMRTGTSLPQSNTGEAEIYQ